MGKSGEQPLNASFSDIDAAIFGGGGYIATKRIGLRAYRLLLFTHLRPMLKAKRKKIPYAIVGLGAGPIHDPILQKITKNALDGADLIIVRNQESKNYLKKYGVKNEIIVTTDLALDFTTDIINEKDREMAEKLMAGLPQGRRIFLHINLYNISETPKNDIERGCSELVKDIVKYAEKNTDAVFILGSDYESIQCDRINKMISKMLPIGRSIIIKQYEPFQLAAILSQVDVVITTKLHVGIVATSLNKTVLSFSGDQKIKRFYRQIGASDRCLELNTLKNGDAFKQLEKFTYAEAVDITEQRLLAQLTLKKLKISLIVLRINKLLTIGRCKNILFQIAIRVMETNKNH